MTQIKEFANRIKTDCTLNYTCCASYCILKNVVDNIPKTDLWKQDRVNKDSLISESVHFYLDNYVLFTLTEHSWDIGDIYSPKDYMESLKDYNISTEDDYSLRLQEEYSSLEEFKQELIDYLEEFVYSC